MKWSPKVYLTLSDRKNGYIKKKLFQVLFISTATVAWSFESSHSRPSISRWYAIYTSASSSCTPLSNSCMYRNDSVHSSKLKPICSIKNNPIKTIYKPAHCTSNQTALSFAPCAQLCLYRLQVEGYSRVWNYLFARWKSLEKPFEYANSG